MLETGVKKKESRRQPNVGDFGPTKHMARAPSGALTTRGAGGTLCRQSFDRNKPQERGNSNGLSGRKNGLVALPFTREPLTRVIGAAAKNRKPGDSESPVFHSLPLVQPP